MTVSSRRALISLSNKQGLVPFAQQLVQLGFELLSTGGTRQALETAGIPVIDVAQYTGFPEMMDGRVKTLHPRVHGGLLGRPDLKSDAESMSAHGITPFELVVVNLYPFVETISKPGVTIEEAIEQIDIGGPSMLRSAAKNHKYVGVVTDPSQYERVLQELAKGCLTLEFRRELAAAAFEMTARYDRAISDYLSAQFAKGANAPAASGAAETDTAFPTQLTLSYERRSSLRYGENPHQRAAFYVESSPAPSTLAAAEILHGKELSYNNLLDLDAAMLIVREFAQPAAVVIKHNNPCGCAVADQLADAYVKADAGDPVSAFGSILGFNREVDEATADQLCAPGHFIEAIIAPSFSGGAFEKLTTLPKWKANVRLLRCPGMLDARPVSQESRRVTGGLLVQDRDETAEAVSEWRVVTSRTPTEEERKDLEFAWLVSKHVKSNAILFAKGGQVIGVGAGQMSRLDSSYIAAYKAGERSKGGVCASDAFFPFRDGIDQIHKAGITAVIQPGGSKRDDEVIAACNEFGIAMIFTGRRHFRH
ncbi:bifunctional phosphoribosylaminoimidazolecarboxamide formyltransferase/IMP cyclohydrolase [Schlesneria sp. DSM 10557]|uniref:bifunctional phosphoribosylaminoimidazolecarboxamide formyltransferase/IMP cyclohydrolase n=1 Tax=Schlesneria sp. DSM 10557 TaxID=3044399 RepID=UPI0035A1050E